MKGILFISPAVICYIQNQIRFTTLAPNHQTTQCHNPEGDCHGERKKRSQFCKSSPFHQLMDLSMVQSNTKGNKHTY